MVGDSKSLRRRQIRWCECWGGQASIKGISKRVWMRFLGILGGSFYWGDEWKGGKNSEKRREKKKKKKNKKWVVRVGLQKLERWGSKKQWRRVARFGFGYFLQEDTTHLKPSNIVWGDLSRYGNYNLHVFFIYLVHSLLISGNNLLIYM